MKTKRSSWRDSTLKMKCGRSKKVIDFHRSFAETDHFVARQSAELRHEAPCLQLLPAIRNGRQSSNARRLNDTVSHLMLRVLFLWLGWCGSADGSTAVVTYRDLLLPHLRAGAGAVGCSSLTVANVVQ